MLFLYGAGQMAIPYWLMARGVPGSGPGGRHHHAPGAVLEPALGVSGFRGSAVLVRVRRRRHSFWGAGWRYWPFNREDKTAKP